MTEGEKGVGETFQPQESSLQHRICVLTCDFQSVVSEQCSHELNLIIRRFGFVIQSNIFVSLIYLIINMTFEF